VELGHQGRRRAGRNGRQPGTGEIHYPAIAAALRRLDYRGVVALEGWASGEPEQALERFRAAFTG
jgi:hydroxypyruvate isomerase